MNRTVELLCRLSACLGMAWDAFRSCRGVAATEFALTLPLWVTMLLGVTDGAYCLLVNQRVDRISYSVTDIVTQHKAISRAQLDDVLLAASQLMQPFPFASEGVVIVSSVYKAAGAAPVICWQYSGGGALTRSSRIGTTGGVPNLPNGLVLNDNENIIVSEVFYQFTPMFVNAGLFSSNEIYRAVVYKPRLSPLITTPL